MKSKLIKDYLEPSKNKFTAMLNDYFDPNSFLTPLDFWKAAVILMEMAHDSHRAMGPPPISIFGSPLEQRGKAAIISRLVLHE